MTDVRTSFPTLEDPATQVGYPLHKVAEGDAVAGKNALPALAFKTPSNNFVYGSVDAAGNINVTFNGAGTPKKARAKVSGNASMTTVVDLALTAGKTYKGLSWVVSCFRDAVFEIVAIDDPAGTPTEVILADALAGPGDFTDSGDMPAMVFVAGATSPVLRVRAQNLNALSDFRAAIATLESAV